MILHQIKIPSNLLGSYCYVYLLKEVHYGQPIVDRLVVEVEPVWSNGCLSIPVEDLPNVVDFLAQQSEQKFTTSQTRTGNVISYYGIGTLPLKDDRKLVCKKIEGKKVEISIIKSSTQSRTIIREDKMPQVLEALYDMQTYIASHRYELDQLIESSNPDPVEPAAS